MEFSGFGHSAFKRVIAVHFLVAVANLYADWPALASSDTGAISCEAAMVKIGSEFDGFSIFRYFPSLLWFMNSDQLFALAAAAGLAGVVAPRWESFASMYLVWISFGICRGMMLWFPWDCLLAECLLIAAVAPSAVWPYRLLAFRVLFGFGKHKFLGAGLADIDYLQTMSCWQPMSTNLGFLASLHAPYWFHRLGLLFTFLTEIILPVFLLFPDRFPRLAKLSALCAVVLMVGIQLLGHFGWFNTLTSAIAVFSTSRGPGPRGLLAWTYCFFSLVFLIPSQWNSPAVLYGERFPFGSVFAVLSSWRVLHSYGVFPPRALPMLKPVGRFEVLCGERWEPLAFKHLQVSTTDDTGYPPFMLAPLRFPRVDYVIGFYSASHVFSLVSGLGPLYGTGQEWVDAVAGNLLTSPESATLWFKSPVCLEVSAVRLMMVALRPEVSGWVEDSVDVDREWVTGIVENKSYVSQLPPSMWLLREASVSKEDCAVVKSGFNHSREWAGHLSCLTAFHLLPVSLHPELCVELLRRNKEDNEFKHTRIDVPELVYWLLGI